MCNAQKGELGERNTRKLGAFLLAFVVLGAIIISLWYATTGIYNFAHPSSPIPSPSTTSYNASCQSLIIRSYDANAKVTFGDTEYYFAYLGNSQPPALWIQPPVSFSVNLTPEIGHSYETSGLRINVVNMSSESISVEIKPTVENYMLSTYGLTRVEIPCKQTASATQNTSTTVSLTGKTGETKQFTFEHPFSNTATSTNMIRATLIVRNATQTKQYENPIGFVIEEAKYDFNLDIKIYKANSDFMIIYIKPLY